jgi:hypothetical protein
MKLSHHTTGSAKITCLIILIAVFIVLFVIVIIIGYFLLRKTPVIPGTDADLIAEAVHGTDTYGTITGSLSYPSEYIPPMAVCATNIHTVEEFCTYEMIEDRIYKYGLGYQIALPAGTYHVYAFVTEDDHGTPILDGEPYRAYYSVYVTCNQTGNETCESHTPITVTVKENTSVTNIDPQDWYDL